MFDQSRILYEDNHLMVVNKLPGELVQPDNSQGPALEDSIKVFLKERDAKPGNVFLGVVHRIDRPVSGAVLFAKTSKALARLNEMIKLRRVEKIYWAVTELQPETPAGELIHYLVRDGKVNKTRVYPKPVPEGKESRLKYELKARGNKYSLLEVELMTGRHHQIRAQLSYIGCPIRGDLKYGARRSNPDGGISLHSRKLEFDHPVRGERMCVTAPVPQGDKLWRYFEETLL